MSEWEILRDLSAEDVQMTYVILISSAHRPYNWWMTRRLHTIRTALHKAYWLPCYELSVDLYISPMYFYGFLVHMFNFE